MSEDFVVDSIQGQSEAVATNSCSNTNPLSSSVIDVQDPSVEHNFSRIQLNDTEISKLTCSDWLEKWRQQDEYVTLLEQQIAQQLKSDVEERYRQQLNDSQHRERMLLRRLAAKEQETQDYVCQLNELKCLFGLRSSSGAPSSAQLPPSISSTTSSSTTSSSHSSQPVGGGPQHHHHHHHHHQHHHHNHQMVLIDPAVNCVIQQLRTELDTTRTKLEDTQNELTAWKFTPDSNTGKRLMAKCRLLYQENEELGRATASGRIAKLEGELALQRSFSEEVRQSQNELDAFLADLDEDVEGMQSTIMFLQQELRKLKEPSTCHTNVVNGCLLSTTTTSSNGGGGGGGGGGGDDVLTTNNNNSNSNSSSNDSLVVNHNSGRTDSDIEDNNTDDRTDTSSTHVVMTKRARRSSVLSIDYNDEEDTMVLTTNGEGGGGGDGGGDGDGDGDGGDGGGDGSSNNRVGVDRGLDGGIIMIQSDMDL